MNLKEDLAYLDMEGKITPKLSIDEFKSRIGEDSDIMVLTFIVDSKAVGEDLVNWLERGYDYILDAEISPGEVLDKKYYVFAEINRRSSAAFRIIDIIEDLKTLTGLKKENWKLKLSDSKLYPMTQEVIEKYVPLSSVDYLKNENHELNEWRQIAGLPQESLYDKSDDILEMQRLARIK